MGERLITTNRPPNFQIVTPSDSNAFPEGRNIYVVTGGDIHFLSAAGQEATIPIGDGSWLPCQARAIFQSGTTAVGIYAVW